MSLSMGPLIGRDRELSLLDQLRRETARAAGTTLLISGDGGVGKTRLAEELAAAARSDGWHVLSGRAYALETAIPYAPFADACRALLSVMDSSVLTRITRGDQAVLTALAPTHPMHQVNGSASAAREGGVSSAEQHMRLHTGIHRLFAKLAEQQPVLLVLENMQWADLSSIELLHFIARQSGSGRMLVVATWNETERDLPDALRTMARSLRSLGAAHEIHLEPLSRSAVADLVGQRFDVATGAIQAFVDDLYDATRGNPFFVQQTLEELVASGVLRSAGGVWVGWQLDRIVLPRTVRDVLQARLERLSPSARRVADLLAVAGTVVDHDVLQRTVASYAADVQHAATARHVSGDATNDAARDAARDAASDAPDPAADVALGEALLEALHELRMHGIVTEQHDHGGVIYDLEHPLLRQALVELVGLVREREIHARIARALEAHHGDRADRYAEQIAAHWRLADPRVNAGHTVHWLLLAGNQALARLAQREAALALQAALERAEQYPDQVEPTVIPELLDQLSRLYRRLGEYTRAIATCLQARDLAASRNDTVGVAIAERRLGLANEGLGRRAEAVRHFNAGIALAESAGDTMLHARLRLAKGDSLQALGLNREAREEIVQALELAEQRQDIALLARAHRMLLKLHTWSGPVHRAWAHARAAVDFAAQSGARNLEWSAHWSAAVLAGFTCSIGALREHLRHAARLADDLRSPLLQLRTAEIAIEFYAGTGEWDRALLDGERAIAAARAINQTSLLARLLYWVSGVYLHRGALADAQKLIDEAWLVSGAGGADLERPFEVHGVLPAYAARVSWLSATGSHAEAIALGRQAVATAERTGYLAWAVYRLLPAIAEAALASSDRETLVDVRSRLAQASATLSHSIGRGWVAIIDGELARQDGNRSHAVAALQEAISTLESVPFPFDAARARLRLAETLQESGNTTDASHEARAALEVLEKLGAASEADRAKALLRALGARVPGRRSSPGLIGLTGRELEIVRLVARRLSNKEVGASLGISARTVGTHLANVFDKVGVRDRTALGDLAREHGLHTN